MQKFINKIIQGDCLDIMKQLPDKCIDLILTDPPYELALHGGNGMGKMAERKKIQKKQITFISNGFNYDPVFNEFIRVCKKVNIYIFCSNKQISKIMSWFENKGYFVTLLVWHKTNAVPLINLKYHDNAEFIICVRESGSTFNNVSVAESTKVFSMPFPSGIERFHPTQKPLPLIEKLIKRKSNEGDLILDCFSGSGTTAIECYKLNRKFICVEKEQDIYKKSVEWLENIQAQQTLFAKEI